jgi:hypothetical protein
VHKRVLMVVVCLTLAGCKSEEEKRREEAQRQLAAAAKQMAQAAAQLGSQGAKVGAEGAAKGMEAAAQAMRKLSQGMAGSGDPKVEVVDFRALKALLPEKLAGLTRTEFGGEKTGAMGVAIAQATARYKGDGGASLRVKLVDLAAAGPIALASFGLAMVEVDKETENGYEKTSTLGGRKSFEKYDNKRRKGELKVLVGSRFVMELTGQEVTMDAMKAAIGQLDAGKLEALAK